MGRRVEPASTPAGPCDTPPATRPLLHLQRLPSKDGCPSSQTLKSCKPDHHVKDSRALTDGLSPKRFGLVSHDAGAYVEIDDCFARLGEQQAGGLV